jgi:chromate reductase, NAD(P)H dehydrogenase (quinone)
MTKKIIAFGATNSKKSINKKLATFAANQIKNAEVTVLDLNDFEMPIYSPERQEEGIPEKARQFKKHMTDADGIIISFAEYNGTYTAAFKNIMDWISVLGKDMWGNNPMLLMATSPGPRGAKTVLEAAVSRFKFVNQNTILSFSLPSFFENFSERLGIANKELYAKFSEQLELFVKEVFPAKVKA